MNVSHEKHTTNRMGEKEYKLNPDVDVKKCMPKMFGEWGD
jgi:hypothetical protein